MMMIAMMHPTASRIPSIRYFLNFGVPSAGKAAKRISVAGVLVAPTAGGSLKSRAVCAFIGRVNRTVISPSTSTAKIASTVFFIEISIASLLSGF